MKYTDPTGHRACDDLDGNGGCAKYKPQQNSKNSKPDNKGCNSLGINPKSCKNIIEKLAFASSGLDQFGYIISFTEAGIADLLYLGVIGTGQYELLPIALKADALIASGAGIFENTAGYLSTI